MHRYHDSRRLQEGAYAPTSVSNQRAPPSLPVEVWYNIDSRYGLTDMNIMPDDSVLMSVEDEYTAYMLAAPSRAVDLVAFWEVNYQLLLVRHSLIICRADVQAPVPHPSSNGNGLSPNPGIRCAL
jgi:hypothetical protein